MLYDIPACLKSATDTIGKWFDFKTISKEHQAESEIIKDDDKKTEALRYADEAFDLIIEGNGYLDDFSMRRFKKLKSKFDEHKIT